MKLQPGLYEATVIDSETISVDGRSYPQVSQFSPDTRLSVLRTVTGGFVVLEKITPAMLDETRIRKSLDYTLAMPCSGEISSLFGPRRSPTSGGDEFHEGVDIANAIGTPVAASAAGTVLAVGDDPVYGVFVRIQHDQGLSSLYGHLQDTTVIAGQAVVEGDNIGTMGNTGKSSGPHLHFGLQYSGKDLNPRVFFTTQQIRMGNTVFAGN